jgi:hypothetical protein
VTSEVLIHADLAARSCQRNILNAEFVVDCSVWNVGIRKIDVVEPVLPSRTGETVQLPEVMEIAEASIRYVNIELPA